MQSVTEFSLWRSNNGLLILMFLLKSVFGIFNQIADTDNLERIGLR